MIDIFTTTKKYKTIYLDPPWEEKGGGKIKALNFLPVKNLTVGIVGATRLKMRCLYENSPKIRQQESTI